MARVSPALLDVLDAADYPVTGDRLRQLADSREAPEAVIDLLASLPSDRSFSEPDDVRSMVVNLSPDAGLGHDETVTLGAISTVETSGAAATIDALARETGLSPDAVEVATGRLTDRDLIREVSAEQDGSAAAGRAYTVKREPHPPGS